MRLLLHSELYRISDGRGPVGLGGARPRDLPRPGRERPLPDRRRRSMSGTLYVGRTIADIALEMDQLIISFTDGFQIPVAAPSPPLPGSRRYMTTSDDLRSLIGHELVGLKQGSGVD